MTGTSAPPPLPVPGLIDAGPDPGFVRLWQASMTGRIVIASGLLLLQLAIYHFWPGGKVWSIGVAVLHLGFTIATRLSIRAAPYGREFDLRWLPTIGIDIVVFWLLQQLQTQNINYTALYALPILFAAVLGSLRLALGTTSIVTVLLLFDVWHLGLGQGTLGDSMPRLLQTGLSGAGYFVVALLANQLSVRLARQERLATQSQQAARLQQRVSELVIDTLGEGILVVDAAHLVHMVNPSARRLLTAPDVSTESLTPPFSLTDQAMWWPLAALVAKTLSEARSHEVALELVPQAGNARRVRAQSQITSAGGESLCVVFLRDLREIEAQLRTERMAAMGRMSAAVAHELRNPLAAIVQANALLQEDLRDAQLHRLSHIIGQNSSRLSRIVDEILNVARLPDRHSAPPSPSLDLHASVLSLCTEWRDLGRVGERLGIALRAPTSHVLFDPDHLRRVLINLLDNALRYASQQPQAIVVSTASDESHRIRLSVWSDGEGLDEGIEQHLFEPFFSSESRSSGLGLFICRELCERHGASISYTRSASPLPGQHAGRQGNAFHIDLRVRPE